MSSALLDINLQLFPFFLQIVFFDIFVDWFFIMLGLELRASFMLGKNIITDPKPRSL